MTGRTAVSDGQCVLSLEDIVAGYGAVTILRDVSLKLAANEVVVVLGANGAGKTTLLRTIAGLIVPRAGKVRLSDDVAINGWSPHLITRAGIGHVPSGRELFPRLSVADHLDLGARLCTPERRLGLREQTLAMFPTLASRLRQRAGTLSGGEQQMLSIARALMTDPRVLLDEPSTGLAPRVVRAVFDTFPTLCRRGVSILLVEQSMTLSLSAADRGYVLDHGRIALSGSATELADDPSVVRAYLGEDTGWVRSVPNAESVDHAYSRS